MRTLSTCSDCRALLIYNKLCPYNDAAIRVDETTMSAPPAALCEGRRSAYCVQKRCCWTHTKLSCGLIQVSTHAFHTARYLTSFLWMIPDMLLQFYAPVLRPAETVLILSRSVQHVKGLRNIDDVPDTRPEWTDWRNALNSLKLRVTALKPTDDSQQELSRAVASVSIVSNA